VKPFQGPQEEEPHRKMGLHGGVSLADGRSGGGAGWASVWSALGQEAATYRRGALGGDN
jgi:hypothetical protein